MSLLEIDLFGGFRARFHDEPIVFPARKAEAFLAYLAATPGELHSRAKISALLWGDRGQDQARQSLRQTVFSVRRLLGDDADAVMRVEGESIGLVPEAIKVDLLELMRLADDPSLRAREEAVALIRGQLLDGLDLDEEEFGLWLTAERLRVEEINVRMYTELISLLEAEGRLNDAVSAGLKFLELDPTREEVHRKLMRLHMKQRRPDAAIRQYQVCADVVRKRLGLSPEPETTTLYHQVVHDRGEEGEGASKPLRALLVEDNALNRELVKAILRERAFDVVTAADGAQALIQLGSMVFDLVILDIELPTLDGLTFLQVMKGNGYDTPVILLTAHVDEEYEIRGLKLGATDFIRKPFQKNVFLTRVEKAIREHPRVPGSSQ